MDMMQIIAQLGFPIAACCAMGWYVKYTEDKHRSERLELSAQHKLSEAELRCAVENNTEVMIRICERLEVKDDRTEGDSRSNAIG